MDYSNESPDCRARFLLEMSAKETRKASYPALPPRLVDGDRLGEYRIVQEIRSGGHSSVFMAIGGDDRRVALKVLSSHLSVEPDAVGRFCAEAAFAGGIGHPSMLPVYGAGSDRGHYFYAMRLESGETLESLVTEANSQPRDEAFYIGIAERMAQLAAGIQVIHDQGIIHRDIKPSNILIDAEGCFVLADFGSALDARHRDAKLESCIGGTLLYMSPEQFLPGADPYSVLGDIYSLGMTLYEISTGISPFPVCSDEEMARLKLTRIPTSPRRLNPNLPLSLDAIIRESIQVEASQRYSSAGELARDLRRFASRERPARKYRGRL